MIEQRENIRFAGTKLSVIGFGGAAISGEGGGYGFGSINEECAKKLLKSSFDAGINVYDTAPVYGFGVSENRIGQAFKKLRDRIFVISKCGVTYDLNKRIRICNDPKIAKEMLEQSLKNLQSDYIDLYMIHWPDDYYDIRYSLEVLLRAKESGKIKYIGLSNTTMDDLKKAEEIVGSSGVDAVQGELNIFNRKAVGEIFPYLKEKKIPFFAWGTLDKGIISGRVTSKRSDYDSFDARSWAPWWKNSNEKEKREKKFQAMKEIADKIFKEQSKEKSKEQNNFSGLHLGIYHNLFLDDQIVSTFCGIRNENQLYSICKAVEDASNTSTETVNDTLQQALDIVSKYVF